MKQSFVFLLIFTLIFTASWFFFTRYSFSFDISPSELQRWLKERDEGKRKFILIDVRTPEEFKSGHIPGTDKNIPVDEIDKRHKEIGANKNDTIILYCRSGRRSEIAKEKLEKLGYKNVLNAGGVKHWLESGFKLEE